MISIQYLLIFYMMQLTVFSFLNFEKKRETKKPNIVIFTGFLILDLFRYLQAGQHNVYIYDSGIVLTVAVVVLVYSLQGFKRLSMWLVAVSSLLISSFISTVASGFLLTAIGIDLTHLNENPIISIIGMVSGLLLFQIFIIISKKLKLQINVYGLSKKEIFIIILFVGMFGFYINNMYNMIDANAGSFRLLINIFSLLIGIVPLFGVMYIIMQKDYIKYVESREQQQESFFKQERTHYQQMNERNKEIRLFKHDIDEELDYIHQLASIGNLDEIAKHIEKMKDVTAKIVRPISQNTGSDIIDAIWYRLTTDERYSNINYEWLGKVPDNIVMDNRHVMKLFANLLKNAFEATHQSQDKYVKVKIIVEANRLAIVIKNSHANKIKENADGTFVTTKLEKENHGIGIRIIKDVIATYNGAIQYIYDENEFTVKIAFGLGIYVK